MSWHKWLTTGNVDWYTDIETGEQRGIDRGNGRVVTRYKDGTRYLTPSEVESIKAKSAVRRTTTLTKDKA